MSDTDAEIFTALVKLVAIAERNEETLERLEETDSRTAETMKQVFASIESLNERVQRLEEKKEFLIQFMSAAKDLLIATPWQVLVIVGFLFALATGILAPEDIEKIWKIISGQAK